MYKNYVHYNCTKLVLHVEVTNLINSYSASHDN